MGRSKSSSRGKREVYCHTPGNKKNLKETTKLYNKGTRKQMKLNVRRKEIIRTGADIKTKKLQKSRKLKRAGSL